MLVFFTTACTLLVIYAAWKDILIRIIPNSTVVLIAVFGLISRGAEGWAPMVLSTSTAVVVFFILLIFAMRGWLGGGDVKLAAAFAAGLPPAVTWDFITATVFAGGILGFGYVTGPYFAPRLHPAGEGHLFARIVAIETRRLRRGGPLPYGVAIAAGGIFVLLNTPG